MSATDPTDRTGADLARLTAALDREAAHLVALASLPGIGPIGLLRSHLGPGAVEAWATLSAGRLRPVAALLGEGPRVTDASVAAWAAAAAAVDPDAELARHRRDGRRVLVLGRPGFPVRLAEDPAPPAVLFADGRPEVLAAPTVAIVGTRNATRVGRELARELGAELAEAGVSVVSGLAYGIDAAAHRGALDAGTGPPRASSGTVGVVAAGLDVAYPRSHHQLHREVRADGVLLSEVPLGVRPSTWRFPARNRLIAGLADAVVVVESRAVGGSMITASEALDRGVTVLAVPGHPGAPAAGGTNELLYDGAGVVRSAADVLIAIGLDPPGSPSDRPGRSSAGTDPSGPGAAVDAGGRAVLAALGSEPASLPELLARTGLDLEGVSAALVALEAGGLVVRSAGWFEATRRGRAAP